MIINENGKEVEIIDYLYDPKTKNYEIVVDAIEKFKQESDKYKDDPKPFSLPLACGDGISNHAVGAAYNTVTNATFSSGWYTQFILDKEILYPL